MVLHGRGRRALEAAGMDVPAMAARPGLQWASNVGVGSASKLDAVHTPLGDQPLLVGSRHAFSSAMLEQVMGGPCSLDPSGLAATRPRAASFLPSLTRRCLSLCHAG